MLHIKDIKFYYEKNHTNYLYTLKIDRGKISAIMGKSGSGKSTLLDIIAGFLKPKSGDILLEGKSFLHLSPQKRPVNILFQSNNLFSYLSVEKNIAVGFDGSFKIDNIKKRKIDAILEEMKLNGYNKRVVSSLSGGEQQRVALSRVLVRDRPILLLDEPFNGLDKEIKIQMLNMVKDITKKRGLYTIFVTHDMFDANLIADEIFALKNGIIRSEGDRTN